MNTNAVSPSAMKRLAGADAAKVAAILKEPGQGVALFQDSSGRNRMVMSYGTFRAELPNRYPPGSVGEMALVACTPPAAGGGPEEVVSPLLIGVRQQQETPQFPTKWANAPRPDGAPWGPHRRTGGHDAAWFGARTGADAGRDR
jgi:hypothetical protein